MPKINDQNDARNWAQQQLKYPYVLVDEDGNINCPKTADQLREIADQKDQDGKEYFIVKGQLPDKPQKTTDDGVK